MSKKNKIKVLSLGIIKDEHRLFMTEGFDIFEQKKFYRALGGKVKFGETSKEALKREFFEEIKAEINNIKYLGCLESIFVYNNEYCHEIIQLYECGFVDPHFYKIEQITFQEKERQKKALWVNIDECLSGKLGVVPQEFLNYLGNN